MNVTIRIKCDNAAFADDMRGSEVARILQGLANDCADRDLLPGEVINLRDVNGNSVGKMEVRP
jgi:hypothetical protein